MIVLVVDDEEGVRESLARALEDEGYEVLTSNSGEDAIKVVRDQNLDLILLDILLPGIDGT